MHVNTVTNETEPKLQGKRSRQTCIDKIYEKPKRRRDNSTDARRSPDDAEEIDVGIVDGEVDEDDASSAVYPQVLLEVSDVLSGDGGVGPEVLVVAGPAVRG